MDNERDYGKCFFQMSYKEAIRQHIISDYKILTMTVSDNRIRRLIANNRILNLNSRDLDEAEAQLVATGIALKRVFKKQGIKHAISFHRSIRAADRFREQQDAINVSWNNLRLSHGCSGILSYIKGHQSADLARALRGESGYS